MEEIESEPASEMSADEKRRDQLLRAAESVEEDAAPRVQVTKRGNVTRVDVDPDAAVRPGLGPV